MEEEQVQEITNEVLVDHAEAELPVDKPTPVVREITQAERDKIIEEYILSVHRGTTAPRVLANESVAAFKVKTEPRTLRDAEQMAVNYFKGENL